MPKRILLVTGKLAEPLVRKYGRGCDVFVAPPVSVAAFLTPPELIVRYLKKAGIKSEDYDFIIIPGLVRGFCSNHRGRTWDSGLQRAEECDGSATGSEGS